MKVIILAAGIGSRLGKPHPKTLTMLANGRTILQNQVKAFLRYVQIDDIYVVVGFKKELIMEAFPELTYVYNDYFDTTNTSQSLLRALRKVRTDDVIWTNGDVVFDHVVIDRLIRCPHSGMAVNSAAVGEEEVKYAMDENKLISQVSKAVTDANGEAVGINLVKREDVDLLISGLEKCGKDDYFERGVELAIEQGMRVMPVDVSDVICKEIDFEEDLAEVNELLRGN